jgi:hypothetical protein
MNWNEFIDFSGMDKVQVEIINPIRKGDSYKKGEFLGFKPGKMGGGHKCHKNGFSFDGSKVRWIKKPLVCVGYSVFTFGGGNHYDWIAVDNCRFLLNCEQGDAECDASKVDSSNAAG